ncbi:hypothetical protein GC209_09215 [bacterium]|nr:hypothetical protein [bacterium]
MQIAAQGISFGFDARTGLLDGFTVEDGGKTIAPLHRAPWVGTGEVLPPGTAPHLATLGGDFFCAPFALAEAGAPMHGWSANAPWTVLTADEGRLRAVLTRTVRGATLIKELAVADGHPFVYQRHIFIGGTGRLPVANHANLSLPQGGLIRTSAKLRWETPATPQESDPTRGRSALIYPAQGTDPRAFPGVGGPTDLTRYPWSPRHEDFVVGLEAPGHWLGWTAVTRPVEGDLYLSLRNAHALPMTMLWHSNGGRDYAPWSGRHFGCLGVEEGAADHMLGQSSDADLTGPGALSLFPDGLAEVRHVIGAVSWPSGEGLAAIVPGEGFLTLHGEGGAFSRVPCRTGLLKDR